MSTDPRADRAPVAATDLVRPGWRRLRLWLLLVGVIVLGAVVVGTLLDAPARPLDPTSPRPNGSKAVVRVLEGYRVPVTVTSRLESLPRDAAVVVTSPDDYSDAQLRALISSARRVVLVRPGTRAAATALPGLSPDPVGATRTDPACADAGVRAAGSVDLPADTVRYETGRSDTKGSDTTSCYHGAVVLSGRLVVLGSADLLQNDHLDDDGVAALDVNALTDSRKIRRVVWLVPGADAAGSGSASIWDLFPPGVYRAFWFVVALGVLLVVWRARRLGGVVREPLPVVVRAAEVVEGHGRLYLRAGARDRAAASLRAATTERLGARLALPRGTSAEQVALALAPVAGRPPADVTQLLAGAVPGDDAGLVRLADELDRLEAALGGPTERIT